MSPGPMAQWAAVVSSPINQNNFAFHFNVLRLIRITLNAALALTNPYFHPSGSSVCTFAAPNG
ncbi:hypothetical protein GGE16_005336 [Rhizobium leguminosarum]|uniref:Uncharacterized protein n=1 Tax=Rhizobium leguminosarum TaxID=384 RepID=A0AAE2MPC2_RHILE|nr:MULTISPECIES: hypothetical protein [Rhizobium]MBB4293251.1 hypothetical protein [Rhizobium leguminosarum]MBB4299926.1 hypothetical protein [Rhizobium leguminosarum]MBB4311052.1 hypothetical protein [Rhizobium leguminosarum]MBB4436651.1 hypothetical protein [Rhizobium esperanzae]MBB4532211.1 hypothetical protein [Rhizobium leguminosarum]